jgi:hypothetical protein
VTTKNPVYAIATSPNNDSTWVTNGTVSGTHKLGDFNPGNYSDGLVMAAGDAKATYFLNTAASRRRAENNFVLITQSRASRSIHR